MAYSSPNRPSAAELRDLYERQRLTSRAIAERCGVEKITVLRWMEAEGIDRRPARGLANRGITPPTAEELHDLVHVQHKSYAEIAAMFGVHLTAVGQWLTKHEITKPTIWGTRRRGATMRVPSEQELRERTAHDQSVRSMAHDLGMSPHRVTNLLRGYGLAINRDGWRGGVRFACRDGHEARSVYEQRVDDWLNQHGLDHVVEPPYPWDARYRADFLVGETYIEIWGVTNSATYTARKAKKIQRCAEAGLDLISIDAFRFGKDRGRRARWEAKLEGLLVERSAGDLFHC